MLIQLKERILNRVFLKWLFSPCALSHFNYLSKSLEISQGLIVFHGLYFETRKNWNIFIQKKLGWWAKIDEYLLHIMNELFFFYQLLKILHGFKFKAYIIHIYFCFKKFSNCINLKLSCAQHILWCFMMNKISRIAIHAFVDFVNKYF